MALSIFYPEAHGTVLERINPSVKLLYLALMSIVVSQASGYEPFIWAAALTALALKCKINLPGKLLRTTSILFLAALIAITDWVSNHDILLTASSTLRFMNLFSLAVIFTACTDTVLLSASLGKALSHVLGKKAYALSADVMLVFALLPEIFQSSKGMLDARRARGGDFRFHPLRSLSEYTVSFLTHLFMRAETFEDALEARLYSREAERLSPPYRRSDILLLALLPFLIGGLAWIRSR